jgi:cyclophilin family peptidyl-prolyl cis-trans isomerase
MPDPKRERQRQNRAQGRQAQLEAARQARKKQSTVRFAVLIGLAVVLAVLAAALFGRDDGKKTSATDQSSSTTATTNNAALASVQCNDNKPTNEPTKEKWSAPPPMTVDKAKKYTATIDTSCGKITVDLDAANAPKTVNNFVFLANKKFYDGLTFHRVVKDFVIQGGDPEGTGGGGPGYEFEDELPQDGYKLGSLAMANSGANTNGSQWFIVTGPEGTQLPNKYSRFGMVTSGLEVAQKLESFADPQQKPTRPLYIFSITIKEG